MPVKFDEYEENQLVKPGTNAYRIISFLAQHPEHGFTPTEISEDTEVPMGSIGPTLQRLEQRGLVRHKGEYWAIAKDDRLLQLDAQMQSLEALARTDDEWDEVDWDEEGADEGEMEAWRAEQRESNE